MIVQPVVVERDGSTIERRATIEWDGGRDDLWTRAPGDLADDGEDASGFLGVALWSAMRRHEDLEVRGPVSPLLLSRCDEIQSVYAAWDPTVHSIEVRATAGRPGRPRRRTRSAAFFSRGVDSTFAAARDRAGPRRRDALVFVDEIEPKHDEAVRAAEIAAAREAADRLELPLVVMSTSVRTFMDPLTRDWEDALAPALSCLAHALARGASTMLVPSGDDFLTAEPAGSSPLLDPLFSTERMRIEHDSLVSSRLGKIRWLSRERPDLLPHLKVCFKENRVDNCGACGKCLLTMACLDLVDSLGRAAQFPDELDVEAISRMRLPHLKARFEWIEVVDALAATGRDDALGTAILEVIRSSALSAPRHGPPDQPLWVDPTSMRNHRLNATLSLVVDGRPYEPPAPDGSGS